MGKIKVFPLSPALLNINTAFNLIRDNFFFKMVSIFGLFLKLIITTMKGYRVATLQNTDEKLHLLGG